MLYTCPYLPGTPRITEATCTRNRAGAENAPRTYAESTRKGVGAPRVSAEAAAFLAGLEPCLGCAGVRELAEAEAAPPPRLLDTSGIGARLREAGHGAGVRRDAGARIARNLGNAKSARMLLDDATGNA